jgi:uncharacterized protein (DUF427 family)
MSLTSGKGPFGASRVGWSSPPLPDGDIAWIEPHPRRIRAERDGRTVIDTEKALLVHRPGRMLAYAFPVAEVGDLPHEAEPEAPGFVTVPWDAVDTWFEEGRQLVTYPPNPYHRVDLHPTCRRLTITVAGTTLVDTDDTLILFETALEPKLYVDPAHVRTDLLRRTETTSWCNYKGWASYWAAEIDGTVVEDVAWSYEDPLPESSRIAGFLSFDPEKVELSAELPQGSSRPPAAGPR